MCEIYVDDEEEVVWRVILEQLSHVNAILEEREHPQDETTSEALKRFARFQQRLLARLYSKLGWEEKKNESTFLNAFAFSAFLRFAMQFVRYFQLHCTKFNQRFNNYKYKVCKNVL